jgi:hypothetical protein
MTKFKRGQSGNPAGKKPGTKNRTSEQLRKALREFVDQNFEDLQDSYNSLEPKERLRFFNDVLKFVLSPPVNPERLSESQLIQIIEYLKNNQNEK